MGPFLVAAGLAIAAIGAMIWAGVPLGRLPGDIAIRRGGFTLYLPIATCVLVSVVLTAVGWLLKR